MDCMKTNDKITGLRVLLVEDNEMLSELAQEMLNDAGIEVVLASNGQESLDVLKTDRLFDCILMDCQMPLMDGYAATKAIRQNAATKDMLIIAMTGSVSSDDEKKILEVGMNDHIAKPYTTEEVIAKLEKWISLKAAAA